MVDINTFEIAQLVGQSDEHIADVAELGCRIHKSIVAPLLQLRDAGMQHGFQLAVASGYRDYARQHQIWNEKVRGQRPVLDDKGQSIDLSVLDDWHKVQAILRWSALPGASRHHWGTEVDVYDVAAMPSGYQLQLDIAETRVGGVFENFHRWLDSQLASDQYFGFFRPYDIDRGGVAPEPWHLSYAPLALRCQRTMDRTVIATALERSTLLLKDEVLRHLDEIFDRFIAIPEHCYPAAVS